MKVPSSNLEAKEATFFMETAFEVKVALVLFSCAIVYAEVPSVKRKRKRIVIVCVVFEFIRIELVDYLV